ncbi:MAG: hypothetical protein ACRDE6_01045 [Candidatus Limnocylindria bacterium]
MALHTDILLTRRSRSARSSDRAARVRLEAELAEATTILHRLLEAEDRIGLVYPVMDDARRFLAQARRRVD